MRDRKERNEEGQRRERGGTGYVGLRRWGHPGLEMAGHLADLLQPIPVWGRSNLPERAACGAATYARNGCQRSSTGTIMITATELAPGWQLAIASRVRYPGRCSCQ